MVKEVLVSASDMGQQVGVADARMEHEKIRIGLAREIGSFTTVHGADADIGIGGRRCDGVSIAAKWRTGGGCRRRRRFSGSARYRLRGLVDQLLGSVAEHAGGGLAMAIDS